MLTLATPLLNDWFSVFAGGTRFSEQGFMVGAAQLNSSLLTVSVVAILIPG